MESLEQYWDQTLYNFRHNHELDDVVYSNFYATSKLSSLNESIATVVVPGNMEKMVLVTNIQDIQKELGNLLGRFVGCNVITQAENTKNVPVLTMQSNQRGTISAEDGVLPNFSFDNFIVGPSNRESHAASLATAYNPGKYYNPLFIFGNSGLGKTHLLNAIGNYTKKHSPQLRVKYISTNSYVDEYITSIKQNSIDHFHASYREIDVLLMDDIQFLAGKDKSNEIFFHLFNELVNNRKQIVITSDRHPDDLKGLEKRLVSRFVSGLSVGIDSPEFETALAILQNKLISQSVDIESIDNDVLSYIASRFASDIRKLEGALNRIIFYAINFSANQRIDLNVALQAFKGMDTSSGSEELTIERIKNVVADYYGLTRVQIISKSRTSNIANARHIAIYLCRHHLDVPFAKIGEVFGKRDHSTIMSSFEKVEKLRKENSTYSSAIAEIDKILMPK